MDISLLSRMIKELIMDNDRVSLPGLGVFAAEFVPASFSDKGYVINPPYRRLYFRGRKADDTLLVDFYALHNDVDPQKASEVVANSVAEIRKVLEAKRVVEFPGLGKLRATKEKTLFFVSDDDLDIYPMGFGLKPVHIKSIGELLPQSGDTRQDVTQELEFIFESPQPSEPQPSINSEQPPVTQDAISKEQVAVQQDDAAQGDYAAKGTSQGKVKTWVIALSSIAAALVVTVVAAIVYARMNPESEFVNSLLYSDEEIDLMEWYESHN